MVNVTGVNERGFRANPPTWYEEDGVIYFSVVSDGTLYANWIKRLEFIGYRLGNEAKVILRSLNSLPTSGKVFKLAVIKGVHFKEEERTTINVRAFASERKFGIIEPEAVCLIRKNFQDEDLAEMGLFWMVGMHNQVDVGGEPRLLGLDRIEDRDGNGNFLVLYRGQDNATWDRDTGFVFEVSS
jgi:hypothetical protein